MSPSDGSFADHAVLIPTSEGPVGGIISAPSREARAAMLLLPSYGRPARSGINSFWTRLARSLAAWGVVVLRVDHSREGETSPIGEGVSGQVNKRRLDLLLHEQVLAWFRGRLDGPELFVAGACAGARIALELAGQEPDSVAAAFLIVPPLHTPTGTDPVRVEDRRTGEAGAVDPLVVERFRSLLLCAPGWILTGEHDHFEVGSLRRLLGPDAARLEVEVVPGVALHFLDHPHLQREARHRFLARVATALGRHESAAMQFP